MAIVSLSVLPLMGVCVQARLAWMHIVLISVWAVQEAAFV